jgi:hypothetical protein
MLDAVRLHDEQAQGRGLDSESDPERQLEQLERSFGPNWKW